MAAGAGKYDKEATAVREATGAHTVLVAVIGGKLGDGFSVQCHSPLAGHQLARLLRGMAGQIEEDSK